MTETVEVWDNGIILFPRDPLAGIPAFQDFANQICFFVQGRQALQYVGGCIGGDDGYHADPVVESPSHFLVGNLSGLL